MSLQSERLLNHMLRLRLSHLPNCYEAIAEEASAKNLPYLDFLEQALEAESQAKHTRNVRLKTQWAHFPYNKGLDQFDFAFQPSVDERYRVSSSPVTLQASAPFRSGSLWQQQESIPHGSHPANPSQRSNNRLANAMPRDRESSFATQKLTKTSATSSPLVGKYRKVSYGSALADSHTPWPPTSCPMSTRPTLPNQPHKRALLWCLQAPIIQSPPVKCPRSASSMKLPHRSQTSKPEAKWS